MLSLLPGSSDRATVRGSFFRHIVRSMIMALLLSAGAAALVASPAPQASTPSLAGPPERSPAPATARHAAARTVTRTGTRTAAKGRDGVPTQVRIEHCQSRGPQVWLTFDDGGSAQQVDRILAVLGREHVQAIFFPIGSWARANPGLVARIASQGHLIGDHTADHVDLAKASDPHAISEIRRGLTHTTGSVPLLRPPFGAGAYTARLDSIASSLGMQLCTWTVDTRDWTGSPAATIVRRVQHGDALTPPVRSGGVIIMHMNGEHTGRALPGVIRAVRARGLRLHALPR